jgi:hypothetical protein
VRPSVEAIAEGRIPELILSYDIRVGEITPSRLPLGPEGDYALRLCISLGR